MAYGFGPMAVGEMSNFAVPFSAYASNGMNFASPFMAVGGWNSAAVPGAAWASGGMNFAGVPYGVGLGVYGLGCW